MSFYYTDEYNVLMLISLLKKHHIKKIVVSPGATNVTFVGSIQQDGYFEIYSSVDERSAAYIATGLAAESGEPVVLSCTGATASRNYIPGLTEAYYRKLPILAVTSTQHTGRVGQYIPQVTDRSIIQNDIAVRNILLPTLEKGTDTWEYEVLLNDALLALTHKGGGPVHINLETLYSRNFSVCDLPEVPVINRVSCHAGGGIPQLEKCRIGIIVGRHQAWNTKLKELVGHFCELYNGIVIADALSNYTGKYRLPFSYICAAVKEKLFFDKLIYIGGLVPESSRLRANEVWVVDPDGRLSAIYRNLRYVFEMTEEQFFEKYNELARGRNLDVSNYKKMSDFYKKIYNSLPEMPFSAVWIARRISGNLCKNSRVYFGSAKMADLWGNFELPQTAACFANVSEGGNNGVFSSFVGAAMVAVEKMYYLIVGAEDLYMELPSVPLEYVGRNIRVIAVSDPEDNRSKLQTMAETLGIDYCSAADKESFVKNEPRLLDGTMASKPMILEVFINKQDEKVAADIVKDVLNQKNSIPGQDKKGGGFFRKLFD